MSRRRAVVAPGPSRSDRSGSFDRSGPSGPDVQERVKEMRALVAVARLLHGTPIPRPLLAKQLADLLPRAFQYADDCVARVRIGDQEATSKGYEEVAGPALGVPLSNGSTHGELWVAYRNKHPNHDDGPFLHEERVLLGSIADMVGMHLREADTRRALGDREMQFRALAEHSPDYIARYDRECRRLYANQALGKLADTPAADLIGRRPSDGPMPPDVAAEMEDAIRNVFAHGQSVMMDVEQSMDGWTRHFSMRYSPELDERGRVVAVLAVGRDVTDLKQSLLQGEAERARMEDLMDNLGEVFYSVDPNGPKILVVSRAVESLYGITREELAKDPLAFLEAVHPDDRGWVKQLTLQGLVEGGSDSIRYRIMDPQGRIRWVDATVRSVHDDAGQVVRIDGHARDVTAEVEAKSLEQSLEESKRQVSRLEDMSTFRAQFLNMAAHELNTPLTPLGLELDLLKAEKLGPLEEPQRRALEMLDRNVRRLKFLVQDMLDAGRMQTGRLNINARPADLEPLLHVVVETFEESAKGVGVGLRLQVEGELLAKMDPYRIEQALVNLVSNAIRYSPDGGAVLISAGRAGHHIRVEVKDHGMGLTAEQIGRLFQPFTQVHEGGRVKGGTGLGLYISKGIVAAHGGAMGVESPGPGRGSTFWFTLPVEGPAQEDVPVVAGEPPDTTAEAPPKNSPSGV